MAKRPSARRIRAARTYTIEEAAQALGVSTGTIRAWVRDGLPLMKARRPFLILGDALRQFLTARATGAKVALQPGQLYCFSCKVGREPMGRMVDCIPQTARTARLVGLCAHCGGTCNRMVSRTKIDQLAGIFDLALKDGSEP
ncbi:helix-turn-helix domain-containing protein [Defluviimonas denitrificans]|jgi:excisionase family DNA binding protein|nr:helix-turn-helix domain-containing protein [Defluviimonas denitrificans]